MKTRDINSHIEHIDSKLIEFSNRFSMQFAQWGIAIIFFWFGILKLIGLSPVDDLIINLTSVLAPSLNGISFVIALGVLEVLIALTIFDRDLLRLSLLFLVIHLILVALPLIFLPEITWNGPFSPTLEGQYIIKNILIVVVATGLLANLKHLKDSPVPMRAPQL